MLSLSHVEENSGLVSRNNGLDGMTIVLYFRTQALLTKSGRVVHTAMR